MEREFKCKTCKKELTIFQCNTISYQFPAIDGLNMPSAGADIYCDKCYLETMV